MWVFYHDVVASVSPMHSAGFELGLGISCLITAGISWFLFTRWCANEDR